MAEKLKTANVFMESSLEFLASLQWILLHFSPSESSSRCFHPM